MIHILSVLLANVIFYAYYASYRNLHAAVFIMQTKFATKREAQLRYYTND